MSTEKTADLTSHIEAAEKAVATVKDPRLREIAFGRVLDHLLTSNHPPANQLNHASTRKPNREKREAKAALTGVTAWLRDLVDEGFFSDPRSMKQVIQELGNRSHHLQHADLTKQLQIFCHDKILRRRKQQPPERGREVYHWSNW